MPQLEPTLDDAIACQIGLNNKDELERILSVLPANADLDPTEQSLQSISATLLELQIGQLDRLRQQALQLRQISFTAIHSGFEKGSSLTLSELEAVQAVDVLDKLTRLATLVQPKQMTSQVDSRWFASATRGPVLDAQDEPHALAPSFSGTLPRNTLVLREGLLTVGRYLNLRSQYSKG